MTKPLTPPEPIQALVERDVLTKYIERESRFHGSRVADRRRALGMSLAEVAALAGTSVQTVFKVEKGQIVARDYLRIALAFALACEVEDLFPVPKKATLIKELAA